MRTFWCWLCYWAVRRWPFSIYNRLSWAAYLWLMAYAGEECHRRGEL